MEPPALEPLTPSMVGKLFGVPLAIIGVMVGGAVVVVFLFGAPIAVREEPIDALMQKLENSSGERSLGILLTREKELWQTALELSERLNKRESELSEDELKSVTDRLTAILQADVSRLENVPTVEVERTKQLDLRSVRFEFLIRALGRTGRQEAVEPLIQLVNGTRERHAIAAMEQLGHLHGACEVRQAIPPIVAILGRAKKPETKVMACTVLSVLANPHDATVLEALNQARLSGDMETNWSASLSLARLGSAAGKDTLLELLDRNYLEADGRYQATDASGKAIRGRLRPDRVEQILIAGMDATEKLQDDDILAALKRLTSDKAPAVRGHAAEVLARRSSSGALSGS